jgi:hypothetical protein
VVWPCKPLSVRSEGPHWALGTGPIDPISLAGLLRFPTAWTANSAAAAQE